MARHTNRLINETSPYLLQHAHNPVDWFSWGDEALQKAKTENKPILVSIGYAACHWCHVMEKESFENEETAAIMNEHFVNIKIDREERPDLDHIYMDAVQAMTGSGGWPLNVFLTPAAKPFYGGTYFPPRRAFNRPSWIETLQAVATAFHEKRNEINTQAENLTDHLIQSNSFGLRRPGEPGDSEIFSREKLNEAFRNIMKNADKDWGGFGKAPKFPQTFSIEFLLRYHYVTGDQEALKQACLSLDKMIEGGIYDQVGGGFARYSTDEEWLAPHFEKMLYDNALLISVLSEAHQLTKKERYSEVIDETIEFVQRELMHTGGGFYAALDADSEGEEGKFYVWQYEEVHEILGGDAAIFCEYFDITQNGNWEGKNILRTKKTLESFAIEINISIQDLKKIISEGKAKLLTERNKRIRPALDDKIILSWNCLMNAACSKAFEATGKERYRQLAIANMEFLLQHFPSGDKDQFHHTWKNGTAKNFAFLDDYAFLIQALLHLQQVTGSTNWLFRAKSIAGYAIKNFSEEETGFFFFTNSEQQDVVIRKKEVYDGATPSGNAIMFYALYHLSIFFDIPEWRQRTEKVIRLLGSAIIHYPASFGVWATLILELVEGTREIAIMGEDSSKLIKELLAEYIPHKILIASAREDETLPLLAGKKTADPPLIYLCKQYSCLEPVSKLGQLIKLIKDQE
jgi:uncharacterized protein YyaL (SSP411 family)